MILPGRCGTVAASQAGYYVVANGGVADRCVVVVDEPFPDLPDGQVGIGGEHGRDRFVEAVECGGSPGLWLAGRRGGIG